MPDQPKRRPDPVSARKAPDPAQAPDPAPRQVGSISRYLGTRLALAGRLLALLGVVLLIFVAVKAYLAYSRHDLGTSVATGIAGGVLGIALMSVGESLSRSGARYLRGEKHLARSVGRMIARRRARRSRQQPKP